MNEYEKFNDEVYYSSGSILKVSAEDIAFLKEKALQNPRERVRLCAHPGVEDLLHEMVIVHTQNAYVRPHKHQGKSESFHIIEGELTVVVFYDTGEIMETIHMAAAGTDKSFYYRLSVPYYHTVFPVSEIVVFHEVTNGPFQREDMIFAPWAPEEGNTLQSAMFMEDLKQRISF